MVIAISNLSLEQINTIREVIGERRSEATSRLNEIEEGNTQRLLNYGLGNITAAELDKIATEVIHLRETVDTDYSGVLAALTDCAEQIRLAENQERNRQEVLEQRRRFARSWNEIISKTEGFSQQVANDLAVMRTPDVDGPSWHRLTTYRASFGAQPEGVQTFGEFANLSPIDLSTIK